jgi:molybdopterin molybdotransferase
MAQLSNDCFAFGGKLMSVEAALALIDDRVKPAIAAERVGLADADGRVLASDLLAGVDLPPFDNSAVDGYAVRFADLSTSGDTDLPVHGRVIAGSRATALPARPVAVRIFTGAPMPAGADTVFMQEDVTTLSDGRILLPAGLSAGANRRKAGEDTARGTRVLAAGHRLTPQDIGLAAALGMASLDVARRPRVAVFSTGNELVSPGDALPAAAQYDSNRFVLAALLRRLGADVCDLGILPDDRDTVARAVAAAAGAHDLVLTSGGVSTGEEDHVRAAVEAAGSLVFWRLAIKPGRPVAMGVVGGTPFVGLPGNPVAVFVTFAHVVRPLVLRLQGAVPEPLRPLPVTAGFGYRKKEGRREYVRVSLAGPPGAPVATKHPRDGAGVITSLTETDGLAELPEDVTRIEPGDRVDFLSYAILR